MTTRRLFIQIVPFVLPVTGVALLSACSDKAPPPAPVAATPAPAAAEPAPAAPAAPIAAATGPMVDEKDATAIALGYVADAAKVDKTKHTSYAAGQACGACALYQGTAGGASGPCPLFPGKQVSSKGWCNSFVKKAA